MTKKESGVTKYSIGERIRYLRGVRRMTQVDLAKKSGLTQSALANLESGTRSPQVSTLEALAKALDLSPAIFFTSDTVLVFDVEKLRRYYKTVDKLPDNIYRNLHTVYKLAKEMGIE